jgi:magnesium chelatase family protein
MARLSGPLLDRIDMHVQVRGVAFERLQERKVGATSEELRGRVLAAREVQLARFQGEACGQNAAMSAKLVARHCGMDASSRLMLQQAFEKRGMSARSYERVLKVARTIADLQGVEKLSQEHLAQALRYRELDLYVS